MRKMFNEEKKQYAEDCKNYERPWENWEYKAIAVETWKPLSGEPVWHADCIYRRKQATFVLKYFSGLNWRDAEHLIGKTVECSNCPDMGWKLGVLKMISPIGENFAIDISGHPNFYIYIRTCEETFKHPTINIGGVELPMPETVAPVFGTLYWRSPTAICHEWNGFVLDNHSLISGQVHLTKKRAEAWADWWQSMVIDKMERN